jgi:hypothetical protein
LPKPSSQIRKLDKCHCQVESCQLSSPVAESEMCSYNLLQQHVSRTGFLSHCRPDSHGSACFEPLRARVTSNDTPMAQCHCPSIPSNDTPTAQCHCPSILQVLFLVYLLQHQVSRNGCLPHGHPDTRPGMCAKFVPQTIPTPPMFLFHYPNTCPAPRTPNFNVVRQGWGVGEGMVHGCLSAAQGTRTPSTLKLGVGGWQR